MTMRWRGFLEDAVEMARPPQQTSSDRAAGDARTDLDLEAATGRLREERDEVRARLAIMTRDLESLFAASADSNADDEHDPEGQTIAYETVTIVGAHSGGAGAPLRHRGRHYSTAAGQLRDL